MNSTGATLTFHGGTDTVTGSRFLVEAQGARILIDCGMFQGGRELRERNWVEPPFPARSIDAVVLTHAHLDHSGYLPVLSRNGFAGPIHATSATRDLIDVLLHDSARIEEEDAAYANRKGYSRHRPALPLFETRDVEAVLRRVVVHRYHEEFEVRPGIRARFARSGHILGSAIAELWLGAATKLVDTGDLGRWDRPILRDPEGIAEADVLLIESTYGDRLHPPESPERLAEVLRAAQARGGALLIPAFAVGRTQHVIWLLQALEESGRIPRLPVYIDSPMANRVSAVTCRHAEDLDEEMRARMERERCPLCSGRYHMVSTKEESIALNDVSGPFVLLAGSGMLTGGRMLHHLKRRLPDERTTVLFTGFQARGTPGRALLDGAESLRIHGMDVRVRARIEKIDGLSAHADRAELLRWLALFARPPRQTYVIHGDTKPARALADAIRERFGWSVEVAREGTRVSLANGKAGG